MVSLLMHKKNICLSNLHSLGYSCQGKPTGELRDMIEQLSRMRMEQNPLRRNTGAGCGSRDYDADSRVGNIPGEDVLPSMFHKAAKAHDVVEKTQGVQRREKTPQKEGARYDYRAGQVGGRIREELEERYRSHRDRIGEDTRYQYEDDWRQPRGGSEGYHPIEEPGRYGVERRGHLRDPYDPSDRYGNEDSMYPSQKQYSSERTKRHTMATSEGTNH